MRILNLRFDDSDDRLNGLKNIKLTDKTLGSVIALAGKNGSGKTRILNLIEKYVQNLKAEDLLYNRLDHSPENNNQFVDAINKIALHNLQNESVEQKLKTLSEYLEAYKKIISPYFKIIDTSLISKINTLSNFPDFDKISFENLRGANNLNFLLTEQTLSFLQTISDELNLEKYNIYTTGEDEKKIEDTDSYHNFERFKKYINLFLGKKLSNRANRVIKNTPFSSQLILNDKEFNATILSPGEKILFSYAILFYLIETNSSLRIENCIFVIDEPENHLHPSAQIRVISAIKAIVKESGQLWIATHSLPLIATLDYDEIFLVKDDTIIPPNRFNPGKSIIELMESEENHFRIKEFLTSSTEWAYANFIVQCFNNPEAFKIANANDPQIKLFLDLITNSNKLSILDYGAGKGRLARVFEENKSLNKRIDIYSALEPFEENIQELSSIKFIDHIYKDQLQLPNNSFDFVILFNVLHEINPEKWKDIFKYIYLTLKESGFLIIVEDKLLPKGEKIDKYGYLILNEYQILDLFEIDHSDIDIINPLQNKPDNRITFSLIPKSKISVSNESIIKSILNLKKEIFGKIEEIRTNDNFYNGTKDISLGRLYAHYTQLYLNTTIAELYLPNALMNNP
jgi:ABC-type cobalamin/Fe3+-siderophores transport system ATPase subunit